MENCTMENGITVWTGRVIKVDKSPYYEEPSEEVLQYYNRLSKEPIYRLQHGEYKGMHLDITFSLYDTENRIIELGGSRYRLPRHVTVEVYKEVMEALGKQRMSSDLYESLVAKLEGEKRKLGLVFIEETLKRNEGSDSVEAAFVIPEFLVNGKQIVGCTKIYLKTVS